MRPQGKSLKGLRPTWTLSVGKQLYVFLQKLVSHYYDTDDFKLLFNNLAFRLREEGSKKTLTLKSNGSFNNGIYIREEKELELDHEDFLSKNFLRKHFPKDFTKL